jgi:4-amino-4-deoxy-L-arabinose transferase-like glycosyltransferase
MKNRWLRIAGIAVAVILVLLIALPFLIDVNSFRPKIEHGIRAAGHRRESELVYHFGQSRRG